MDAHRIKQARDRFYALLDSSDTSEPDCQKFFTENKFIITDSLLFGMPEYFLNSCRPGKPEADFYFFPRENNFISQYGVIEVKKPSINVWTSPRKDVFRLSANVATAVSQANKYCNDIKMHLLESGKMPRVVGENRLMFVIAGRSDEIEKRFSNRFIMPPLHELDGCVIVGYDQLYHYLDSNTPKIINIAYPLLLPNNTSNYDLEKFIDLQNSKVQKNIDIYIVCEKCLSGFIFSSGAQDFYKEKGFSYPKWCQKCRQDKKAQGRTNTIVDCSGCGQNTVVPFKPSGDRPIYCRDCMNKNRQLA